MIRKLAVAVAVVIPLASCGAPSAVEPPKGTTTTAPDPGPGREGEVAAGMNRAADPCNDFYEFANGNWLTQNALPAAKPRWSRRAAKREENQRKVQGILEELAAKKDWPSGSIEQQVGDHYASCMDEATIDAAGLTPLGPLLAELDGIRNRADVQRAIRRLHELAVPAPFGITGAMDNQEPLRFIVNVAPGVLGLPDRDHYLKQEPRFAEARAKYLVHVAAVFKLKGMADAQAKKAADSVFALEKRLAGASLDGAAAGAPGATEHKMTFAQLQKLAPSFDWATYFDEAKLPRADLNVHQPELIKRVNKELKATPVSTWKTYLTWQLLDSASPWLSKPFAEESFSFKDKFLGGAAEMKPRAALCGESTEALLGEALGKKYVEKYFPPEAKAKAMEILQNLLAVLKEDVARVPWMTPETKKKALEKLASYRPQAGYPDSWADYSGVTIRREAFWENVAAARKFAVDDNRSQIGKPSDPGRWQLPASSSGAYLDLQLNTIVLPAGFLQAPAFRLDATDAVNYGGIGAGVAHDMTHAIDAGGADLDPQGRPKNWWSDADRKEFETRGQCVIDQYQAYDLGPGVRHDGKLVLSEAIGDLAGVRLAYLALQRSMKSRPVPVVDGLTPEQQFFVSYGQFRAEALSPETQQAYLKSDTHALPKYRVIGPLSTMPEFHQAFSCKAGAAMVRPTEKRCEIW
jgi:endothelin-converting enzyme/putative endopeptidase